MHPTAEGEIPFRVRSVNQLIEAYLKELPLPNVTSIRELQKSLLYSSMNGGKRFRPVLTLLAGELLGASTKSLMPFAMAVEMIHTYSLIHDDLPSMDNDDMRRGKPTNHKVFGEDFALLAGDALLTEAFLVVATSYDAPLAIHLVRLLSEAAGIRGMVGGQAIDLRPGQDAVSVADLTQLHLMKTGALIRVAAEGAGVIAQASAEKIFALREFGESLGLAFQIADDILDHGETGQDLRSFTGVLGLEKTQDLLKVVSQKTHEALKKLGPHTELLEALVEFNLHRQV